MAGHDDADAPAPESTNPPSSEDKTTVVIEGQRYDIIPYGMETDYDGQLLFSKPCHVCGALPHTRHSDACTLGRGRLYVQLPTCRDCGVPLGRVHVVGCGIEQCPRCGHQYMSCSCESEEDNPDAADPDYV